jgi:hypothetical protein
MSVTLSLSKGDASRGAGFDKLSLKQSEAWYQRNGVVNARYW